jgi:uncharacterized protein (DUF342 family)
MRLAKTDGPQNLRKDLDTGAVININSNEINRARYMKQLRKEKEAENEALKNEVSELRDEIGQIKSILQKLEEKL